MSNGYVKMLSDYRKLDRAVGDMMDVSTRLMHSDLFAIAQEAQKIVVELRAEIIAAGGEEDLINNTVRGHAQ